MHLSLAHTKKYRTSGKDARIRRTYVFLLFVIESNLEPIVCVHRRHSRENIFASRQFLYAGDACHGGEDTGWQRRWRTCRRVAQRWEVRGNKCKVWRVIIWIGREMNRSVTNCTARRMLITAAVLGFLMAITACSAPPVVHRTLFGRPWYRANSVNCLFNLSFTLTRLSAAYLGSWGLLKLSKPCLRCGRGDYLKRLWTLFDDVSQRFGPGVRSRAEFV